MHSLVIPIEHLPMSSLEIQTNSKMELEIQQIISKYSLYITPNYSLIKSKNFSGIISNATGVKWLTHFFMEINCIELFRLFQDFGKYIQSFYSDLSMANELCTRFISLDSKWDFQCSNLKQKHKQILQRTAASSISHLEFTKETEQAFVDLAIDSHETLSTIIERNYWITSRNSCIVSSSKSIREIPLKPPIDFINNSIKNM